MPASSWFGCNKARNLTTGSHALVSAGTIEVRIRVGTAHRVFAVTKFAEAIYVLHTFEKKWRKRPKNDIDFAAC